MTLIKEMNSPNCLHPFLHQRREREGGEGGRGKERERGGEREREGEKETKEKY